VFETFAIAGVGVVLVGALIDHFVLRRGRERGVSPARSPWVRSLNAVLALSVVLLAASGVAPMLTREAGLRGWWLLTHMVAAPFFALTVTAASAVWARALFADLAERRPGARLFYWAFMGPAFVTLCSAALSMTRFFDQDGLRCLYEIHRYSASLLVMAGLVGLYRFASGRAKATASGSQV
jgi:hypothetical protein